jgi:acetyl esterase/lipase
VTLVRLFHLVPFFGVYRASWRCSQKLIKRALLTLTMLGIGPAEAAQAQLKVGSNPHDLAPSTRETFLELETYTLWHGRAPQSRGTSLDEVPALTVFRPQKGYANGSAVIVAPGGAYIALAASLEGRQIADWFAARGVTAFLLRYRFGAKARLPVPLLDGRRAVRFVRAHADKFGLAPHRIGMIGFSAGGHLSAMTAATADGGDPTATDPVERASSRPDFVILGYPWLEATQIDAKGNSQYCQFSAEYEASIKVPRTPCNPKDYTGFAPTQLVSAAMPPTFIYHTTTDALVSPMGSVRFYEALIAKKVPAELHIFATGQHGTGLGGTDPALMRWPDLLDHWLRALGIFSTGSRNDPAE